MVLKQQYPHGYYQADGNAIGARREPSITRSNSSDIPGKKHGRLGSHVHNSHQSHYRQERFNPNDVSSITDMSALSTSFQSSTTGEEMNSPQSSACLPDYGKAQHPRDSGSSTSLADQATAIETDSSSESSGTGYLKTFFGPDKARALSQRVQVIDDIAESTVLEEGGVAMLARSTPTDDSSTRPPASQRSFPSFDGSASIGPSSIAQSFQMSESDATPVIRNIKYDPENPRKPRPPPATKLPRQEEHDETEESRSIGEWLRTTQGIIVLALCAIFLFGVLTVIVSTSLSVRRSEGSTSGTFQSTGNGGSSSFQDDLIFSDIIETSVPSAVERPSLSPTISTNSPSDNKLATAGSSPPSPAPSPSKTAGITLPPQKITDSPDKISVTDNPTPLPTQQPPTLSPTPFPTDAPSSKPTLPPIPIVLTSDRLAQEQEVVTGTQAGETMGHSVALSHDGRVMAVGAANAQINVTINADSTATLLRAGRVQVYTRDSDGNWIQRGKALQGQQALSQFGFTVVLNDDGRILAVSEPTANTRTGRVHIFEWSEEEQTYNQMETFLGDQPTDHFGIALSLSGNGRRLAVGAPYHSTFGGTSDLSVRGQVQVFDYSISEKEWQQTAVLMGEWGLDWFGWSLDLSGDGSIMAVGAPRNTIYGGYVVCYRWESSQSTWMIMGDLIVNFVDPIELDDRFGHAVSVSASGPAGQTITRLAIGCPWKDVDEDGNSGMVLVYEWDESASDEWSLVGEPITQAGFYNQLGYSVKVENDVVAVGIPGVDDSTGQVNIWWLGSADDELAWESLDIPISGYSAGDDLGYSVHLAVDKELRVLLIAGGAIMASSLDALSSGYAVLFDLAL